MLRHPLIERFTKAVVILSSIIAMAAVAFSATTIFLLLKDNHNQKQLQQFHSVAESLSRHLQNHPDHSMLDASSLNKLGALTDAQLAFLQAIQGEYKPFPPDAPKETPVLTAIISGQPRFILKSQIIPSNQGSSSLEESLANSDTNVPLATPQDP